jgi:signal transduction histidine kinase
MLSLPGIRGLIRNRDNRNQETQFDPGLFSVVGGEASEDTASYVLRLAEGLGLDVLVLIELENGGKSAKATAAGMQGLTCSLTIPTLENVGRLSSLIDEARPASGTGKIFAQDEVFPCEATWCDFIPLDSIVAYCFVPVDQLPAAAESTRRAARSQVRGFVLGASAKPDAQPALGLRTVAAASLINLSLTRRRLALAYQAVDALKNLARREGYSLCAVSNDGTITERNGSVFSEIKPDTLRRLGDAITELAGRNPEVRRSPQMLAWDDLDGFEALAYPIRAAGVPDHSLVALRPAEVPSAMAPRHSVRGERLGLLSRFMSSIAHEIKNPLTGIAAGVQYLSKKLQAGATEDDTVGFVLAEINRLNRIVDDLYRIAKPPELTLGRTSINDVVAKSLLSLSERIVKKGLTVRQDLLSDLYEFEADADRLQQVVINIIKNAIEASPEKGEIRIETSCEGSNIAVRITDSGPGILAEDRERVFEPFFSKKKDGTGLGLCISQRIVDQHGGSIYIEDAPQCGATFVIELPIRR